MIKQSKFFPLSINAQFSCTEMKIAVRKWIFPTDLIKLLVSYVDKFSKMSNSKKKDKKILKIVEFIRIITHNSQHKTLLNVTMIKGKCKIKQK